MRDWKQRYATKLVTVEEAASHVKNGDRIYFGSMCSEPKTIIEALGNTRVEDVEIVQFIRGDYATNLAAKIPGRFVIKSFFVGGRTGEQERPSEADYVPLFHSQIPNFFRNRRIAIDVALIQVAPPDRFGRFSLGISVDITKSAVESARIVIAQVNSKMPRTSGDASIMIDDIDYLVEADEELFEMPQEILGERERIISYYCGELIDDGSILQFGFAGISQGLMDHLKDRRNLGLHTEILTEFLVDLIECGAVNNSTKKMYRGKSLATCCMGTRRLYDFVDNNSMVEFYTSDVVLNPLFIAANDKVVAVNLALQVDLRGQIRQGNPTWTAFEGSGGDHDFMLGASMSRGGRSIVCLRSTSIKSGRSTIVPSFGPKAAVIMNRGEVNYIVTEYGIAYLGGRTIRERAMALIEVAHPDHREDLMRQAREMGYIYPDQIYYKSVSPEFRQRIRRDHLFRDGLKCHIRAVRPTDETMLRDLFYNLSESSIYFRYFSPKRSMPHKNLQSYANLREDEGVSIVVTTGPRENRKMIAEARYMIEPGEGFADTAFMVDENYQGRGIATYLLNYLIEIAKERGLKGFKADVLFSNQPMLKVYEKVPFRIRKRFADGVVSLSFRFDEFKDEEKNRPPVE
ncbi:MAG: GNAT family N-acetyltransferase [Deltaproteobacteria bacterium]|nr:GNAT family N-acetyltransferase [Deltaproteobacteria bacterium]